ncbi:hypothetical protein [Terriglobus roseus]|uniref:YcxB-like protein domain-containing protein n=1 Tax=Terriglobus roseus TaxID=392734 RepID=A0A1H4P8F2_9BACT|nr:hypothetical protein [Terriglobus roseus]SEC03733.1 hypothetical protein SAMN05443244_2486 [Terriglobus roseus]
MRITYQWTEREWDQAVCVATRKATRGTALPGMVYPLIVIPLCGAVGDLISLLRPPGRANLAGSILPLLLLLSAITAGILISVSRLRRRRQRNGASPMPDGVREMVLQESGWRFHAFGPHADPSTLEPLPQRLRPWTELLDARQGSGVIVLLHRDGFEAVPAKSLTPEQAGHLHRLVMRKLKPAA